jgi:hypothetical protein
MWKILRYRPTLWSMRLLDLHAIGPRQEPRAKGWASECPCTKDRRYWVFSSRGIDRHEWRNLRSTVRTPCSALQTRLAVRWRNWKFLIYELYLMLLIGCQLQSPN